MSIQQIPVQNLACFSKTDRAFAGQNPELLGFHRGPNQDHKLWAEVLKQKAQTYTQAHRQTLVACLKQQYGPQASAKSQAQINRLGQEDCFCISTAHQPCILGGPMYFMTKALDCLALNARFQAQFPEQYFVPIFWLGGEDHDFEEINHLSLFQQKITWTAAQGGAVGQHQLQAFQPLLDQMQEVLGQSPSASELMKILQACYGDNEEKQLNQATRALLDHFFGAWGLLVLDPDQADLKNLAWPLFERDLNEQISYQQVRQSQKALENLGYKAQAYARPINLFYLGPNYRQRLEQVSNGGFQTADGSYHWADVQALKQSLQTSQGQWRLSPNVILRPLVQEWLLPNLAYVGGGGELAYWLERKAQFEAYGLAFPLLFRRTSFVLLEPLVEKRLEKLGLDLSDVLNHDYDELARLWLARQTPMEEQLDFTVALTHLDLGFEHLAQQIGALEPSLAASVRAEASKNKQQIEKWREKLVRSFKKQHETSLQQLQYCYQRLRPNGGLQERVLSIWPFYLQKEDFWQTLYQACASGQVSVVSLKPKD